MDNSLLIMPCSPSPRGPTFDILACLVASDSCGGACCCTDAWSAFASIEDQIRVDSQINVKRLPNANYSGAARNDLLLLQQFALARYLGPNITSHFEYGIIVVFSNLRLAKADVTGCNEAQEPSSNPVSKACSCNALSAE